MNTQTLANDLLSGAKEIARFLGWPVPRVTYMVRAGHIPVIHVGRRIYARKSELEAMFTSEVQDAETVHMEKMDGPRAQGPAKALRRAHAT